MESNTYNQLLLRQINEALGDIASVPTEFQPLLQSISDYYNQFDKERTSLESQVKLRTDQLMASTSRAYSFLDSLHMGFIMCDVSAEVVLTNQAVQYILSQKMTDNNTQAAPVANTDWTLAAIDGLLQPELQLKKLVLQSLATSLPLESKETNFGKRVLHLFIAPMINELSSGEKQQIGAVILVEDITEQKILERSKDEFLSIASHELRTPLTAIRGNASLIKKYYGDRLPDKDTIEMIDDIHESAIRLIDIVNDFLDVSSLEQGKMKMNPEAFSLGDVVSGVMRELKALADSKGITLLSQPDVASAPSVTADKQRIKQVIYNLIGNAVKFTDTGSITIAARADEHFVYVTVTDTGKGMSTENQRLLFRKFQQAGDSLLSRDATKGTGLGLYISKLIIGLSGGNIGLQSSELGKGSSFTFSLPRSKPGSEQVPAQAV
jgi:signal transduction histidine kinase